MTAPGIGWQKDIFRMTRFARALKWMTCFISNDRASAFTAHLLLAALPSLCSVAAELWSLKEAVGTVGRCRFHLDYGNQRGSSGKSKVWLVFDQRSGGWVFSGELLVLVGWFPHYQTVRKLITYNYDSSIDLLTQLLEREQMSEFESLLNNSPMSSCWQIELLSRFLNCRDTLDV